MRRMVFATMALLASGTTLAHAQAEMPVIEVIKQAECGCCGGWVEQMQAAGYELRVKNVSGDELVAAKEAAGLGEDLWACHTARVGGYTVEGHVPAREIARLLQEQPAALGIAVPGMPMGSPGMDYGDAGEPYEVILVAPDGTPSVFASYPAR